MRAKVTGWSLLRALTGPQASVGITARRDVLTLTLRRGSDQRTMRVSFYTRAEVEELRAACEQCLAMPGDTTAVLVMMDPEGP